MSLHVNCEWARNYLPLFLYNELSFEEEEALQTHLGACPDCRSSLEAERRLHAALDSNEVGLPAALLTSCRDDLSSRLQSEVKPLGGIVGRVSQWWQGVGIQPAFLLKPAVAIALLAVGFFGGRMTSRQDFAPGARSFEASVAEPVTTRVRGVEPSGAGQFQIVVDETRQRVLSGSPEEDRIRQLLIAATIDPSDPGLRGETIEILSSAAPNEDVRQALLQVIENDSNDGVRLRALQGLKPIAHQSEVRQALARVLVKDPNAGIRTQAIDLLTEGAPGVIRENEIIGVFQDLMGREQNHYIRMRVQRQLQQVKASTGVY